MLAKKYKMETGGINMARTRILRKKIREILEREGPLTGGQIKEYLDNDGNTKDTAKSFGG